MTYTVAERSVILDAFNALPFTRDGEACYASGRLSDFALVRTFRIRSQASYSWATLSRLTSSAAHGSKAALRTALIALKTCPKCRRNLRVAVDPKDGLACVTCDEVFPSPTPPVAASESDG